MKKKKILIITATHGDEPMCVDVAQKIKKGWLGKNFDLLIANPKALKKNKRYIDADLNRIFPGKLNGNYEEKRAKKIIKISKNYDYVIDLHGSNSKTGIFIIITKLTLANLLLALKFDIKKIIIWPDAKETTGSISTFMPAGIEIESGPKTDPEIQEQLAVILIKFIKNENKKITFKEEIEKRKIYEVTGVISKKKPKPKNLENWKKINDYYPIFVGSYNKYWCYKLKKTNLLKIKLLRPLTFRKKVL
ncbi:MAG: succinylglutamate desuccinylase/aspartoacylase family protein [Patescibacteria group bacterium]|jgi:succinylglutamate desuccinylase